jgi:tetratricopeptide (TPR) repeat protein
VYATISGKFDVSVAVARKIDSLNLKYRPSSLLLFADAIKKRNHKALTLSFNKHKDQFPDFFKNITNFWLLIANKKKDEAFSFINSIKVNSETQLRVIYYNQLLAYIYFDDYELASTLYKNGEFDQFLFDSNSSLIIANYFYTKGSVKLAVEILEKIRVGSKESNYSLVLFDHMKKGGETKNFSIDPYSQISEIFFRWSQATSTKETGYVTKLFYLSLAAYASNSSFYKLNLGNLLVALDNNELALKILKDINSEDIFYLDSVLEKVLAYDQNNQTDIAETVIKNQLKQGLFNSELLKYLGDIQRNKRLFSDAIKSYTNALMTAKKENNVKEIWSILFLRGIAFEELDNWDLAENDFIEALKIRPDQPQVLNYMGYSLLERKEKLDQAMRMIIKAEKISPESYHIVDSLGWAFYRLGKFSDALIHLERAMELEALDPIVNDHLGDTFWQLGRKREARFQWKKSLNLDPEKNVIEKIKAKLEFGLKD